VVLSHGGGGAFDVHEDTATALAQAGFVVAAISHAGDTTGDESRVLELWRRPRQLHSLIDFMLREWGGRQQIDPDRIGAFGFSNGGFTVLVAAGGTPRLSAVAGYCRAHPAHDLCSALQQANIDPASIADPAPDVWIADTRIKAIVAAAPAFGFTFDRAGLRHVNVPVQLWGAADDGHQPAPFYEDAVRDALPRAPEFHRVRDAGHYAFLPPCPPALAARRPAICVDRPGFDRARFHRRFNDAVVAFFRQTLAER
jgi:predicted dienelactone hydrolase